MRFKYTVYVIALISAAVLAGCADIKYTDGDNDINTRRGSGRVRPEYNDSQSLFYPVVRHVFTEKHQLEDLTSYESHNLFEDFEGTGYIRLDESHSADFELYIPSPQHYAIGIKARVSSDDGSTFETADLSSLAVVALTASGVGQGAFYVTNTDEFSEQRLHGIYLEAGLNRFSLAALKGTVYIDYLTINDYSLPESRFAVSTPPANQNSSNAVRLLMDYFGEIFGEKVLLAQHVTPGTNTEIGAIHKATGRLPAIRVSDLMRLSRSFIGDSPQNDDIELAVEWAESGGIVAYDWTWYSPSVQGGRSHYYAVSSDFNLNEAYTTVHISDLDAGRLEALRETGVISRSCYELVLDIDHMAENLLRLRDENIPVLWRPLHQAGTGWFWWGDCEPEAYKWLWRLMFERFSDFHGLDNLIWVWAGQSPVFYPGDDYVDIIGEDIYNLEDVSSIPVFVRTADYSARRKLTAMTEAGLLPSPDLLARDRALWLWCALYRGDFLIDGRGDLNEQLNDKERLHRVYNHELTVTLDKLPEEF
ncbi:MAG: hypothetical protein FWG70_00430 [Oscillospiraceae bacterium]|nr:hypothetical protein [Oscillospiraceae bacterium]